MPVAVPVPPVESPVPVDCVSVPVVGAFVSETGGGMVTSWPPLVPPLVVALGSGTQISN